MIHSRVSFGLDSIMFVVRVTVVAIVGAALVDRSVVPAGMVMASLFLAEKSTGALGGSAAWLNNGRVGLVAFQKVLAFMKLPDEAIRPPSESGRGFTAPSVTIEHLSLVRAPNRTVISDLSVVAEVGAFICLVGPPGCGKSSVMEMLVGLLRPTSGSISVGGIDPATSQVSDLRKRISYVQQRNVLLSGSIRDNIVMASESIDSKRIDSSVQRAGLKETLDCLPLGLDTNSGDLGERWSGGERARISVARALAHDRSFLFLDEPTAALDSQLERRVIDELAGEAKLGRTVVLVTHHIDAVPSGATVINLTLAASRSINVFAPAFPG